MGSLGVIKPDMRIERQDTLSPFGLLTELFTEELLRRNSQAMGNYRPMQLAYLEEGDQEGEAAPPEIHFDLDVDLIVNRLLKQEREKKKETGEKKTPAERILERVILREKEIRTAYPETRRIVVESGGRRISGSLPVSQEAQTNGPGQGGVRLREITRTERQAGERRSTQQTQVLRPSAALAPFAPATAPAKGGSALAAHARTLTLASQAMSVPAAGGWTPQQREIHPGYPMKPAETGAPGRSAGSILLPDVMRRRREAALERRETAGLSGEGPETLESLENALTWATEGTDETPEAERVLREVRRAVLETIRRNTNKETVSGEAAAAERSPEKEQPVSPVVRVQESTQKNPLPAREETARAEAAAQRGEAPLKTAQPGQPAPPSETAVPQDHSPTETRRTAALSVEAEPGAPAPLIYREEAEQPQSASSLADIGRQPSQDGIEKRTPVSAGPGAAPRGMAAPVEGWTAQPAGPASHDVPASLGAKETSPLITAAVPAEAAALTEAPAALVYREGSEEAALPQQIGDARPTPSAAEAVERRQQAEPRSAAPEAKQAEPPHGRRETAPSAAVNPETVSAAVPGEAASAVQAKREELAGPASPPTPQQSAAEPIPQRTPAIVAASGEEQPRDTAIPAASRREDTGSEAAVPAAIPAEPAAPAGEPTALVYREGSEGTETPPVPLEGAEEQGTERTASTFVKNEASEQPVSTVSTRNQQPAERSHLPEEALQAAVPEAIPTKPAAPAGESAALVYLEDKEEPAPSPAPQQSGEAQKATRAAAAEDWKPEQSRSTVSSEAEQHGQRPVYPEMPEHTAVIPAAVPAGPAGPSEEPAALVYREEANEPSQPLTPPQRAEDQRHPEAEAATENREAEQFRRTASPAGTQTPLSPGMLILGAETPSAEIPAAIPAGSEVPAKEPAALIYREAAKEPSLPSAPQQRSEEQRSPGAEAVTENRAPEPFPDQASPTGVQHTQTPIPPETLIPGAEIPTVEIPAAIPAESAAPESAPAVLVYREGAQGPESPSAPQQRAEEQKAPAASAITENQREEQYGRTVPPESKRSAQTPEARQNRNRETESPAAALPAGPTAAAGENPPLVYREGAESLVFPATEVGEDARPAAGKARPVPQQNSEEQRFLEKTDDAAEGEAAKRPQSMLSPETDIREQAVPASAIPTAIPQRPDAATGTPAELVYREEAAEEAPQAPETGKLPRQPEESAVELPLPRNVKEKAPQKAFDNVAESRRDDRPQSTVPSERKLTTAEDTLTPKSVLRENEIPAAEIPTAIPAEPAAVNGPAALVYREETAEGSHQTPGAGEHTRQPEERAAQLPPQHRDDRQPQRAAETVVEDQRAERPRSPVSKKGEQRSGQMPVQPDLGLTEAEIPSEAFPAALPAEPEAPSEERNVLVYREAAEGAAARTDESGEASPQPVDGGARKASPVLPDAEEIGGRSAQALPAQPVTGETGMPVSLTHRMGSDLLPAAAVGRVSRDIRVTAEHGPNPPLASKRGRSPAPKEASPTGEKTARTVLPLRTSAETEAIPAPVPLQKSERMAQPAALVYAATAQTAENLPEGSAVRPTQKAQDDRKESLPGWAKELLEQAGVTDTAQQAAAFNGRLDGVGAGRTVNWSAPGTGTPSHIKNMSEPAELSFKEKESAGETPTQTRISDEEIRRAADRVYRIIEERLRLELRRGGR